MIHQSTDALEEGLPYIKRSPKSEGSLKLIVIRPQKNEREILENGELDLKLGLKGDNWLQRSNRRTVDGSAHPDKQINIMNARAAALIAGDEERWALAGDQLYIDFDIGEENLPTGSQITIGEAILEITAIPHNGCMKFKERFGLHALRFVNSTIGKQLHLRGVNARIIKPGSIKKGDSVTKL